MADRPSLGDPVGWSVLADRLGVRVIACWSATLALLVGGAGVAGAAVPRFSVPVKHRVGDQPVGMIACNLNRDRKADLATVDFESATVSVLLGRGDGSFRKRIAYRTARNPAGITLGDVDSDGDRDLITASIDRTGSISVFSNRGAGRFRRLGTYASGRRAFAVAAADVNRDGRVDLLTANNSREEFAVLFGTGAGRFIVAHRYSGSGASDVAVGDINGDGILDVAHGTTYHTNSVAVRLGVGDGTFGPATAYRSGSDTYAVTLADFNNDDKLDVAAANYGNSSVSALLGAGDGTLGARTQYGMGLPSDLTDLGFVDAIAVADFDRDGHSDIATPGYRKASVRRGRGDGTFLGRQRLDLGDKVEATGGAAAVADFSGDRWPDLALGESCDYVEFPGCPQRSALVFLNRTARMRFTYPRLDIMRSAPSESAKQMPRTPRRARSCSARQVGTDACACPSQPGAGAARP